MTNAVFAGITANRIASIWMLIELTFDTALVSIGVKASAILAGSLIAWGKTPERTEAFVKGLPHGNSILNALAKLT